MFLAPNEKLFLGCAEGHAVDELLTLQSLISLCALTSLEIVLGIDNVVFIAILVAKLPPYLQPRGHRIALSLAMASRIAGMSVPISTAEPWIPAGVSSTIAAGRLSQ